MTDSGKRTYTIVVDYIDKETKQRHHIFERDLSFEDTSSISKRYEEGENFMVRGVVIRLSDAVIEEFHIYDANRNDMTRKFVKSTPKKEAVPKKRQKEAKPLSKNVFIVHGKDHKPMKELKAMLYEFRLNSIVLHEKASGGLTLAEKLEKYAENIGFAFVILTPDDIGVSFGELYDQSILAVYEEKDKAMKAAERILAQSKGNVQRFIEFNRRFVHDPSDVMEFLSILKARARQNVIFEMGYFWGLLERKKVCCLLKGDVEKPSDIEGIVYIPFKESVNEVRNKIVKELKEAGYENLYPPSVPKPI